MHEPAGARPWARDGRAAARARARPARRAPSPLVTRTTIVQLYLSQVQLYYLRYCCSITNFGYYHENR